MITKEYLDTVLATEGIIVLATYPHKDKRTGRDIFWHYHFTNTADAANFSNEKRLDKDVYTAMHTMRELSERTGEDGRTKSYVRRTAENAAFARSFYGDLDVGNSTPTQKKYATREDALAGLKQFCKAVGLPRPMIVFSGAAGVHFYWLLEDNMPSAEWQVLADKLKRLMIFHGLVFDHAVPADRARVLRGTGTFNLKDRENPVKVKLGAPAPRIPNARMRELIEGPASLLPDDQANVLAPISDGLPPPDPKVVAAECQAFVKLMELAPAHTEPQWKAFMMVGRHTSGGRKFVHAVVKQYPDYTPGGADYFLDRYDEMNLGPSTCSSLDKVLEKDSPCKTCPHWGLFKSSPIVFARRRRDEPLPSDLPEPDPPWFRTKRGIEWQEPATEEEPDPKPGQVIYDRDFYPRAMIDDPLRKVKAIEWVAALPRKGDSVVTIPIDLVYQEDKLLGSLANNGVIVDKRHGKRMGAYMSHYIRKLQAHQAEQHQWEHMGWSPAFDSFALRDGLHTAQGIKPITFSDTMAATLASMEKQGTMAGQIEALNFFRDKRYVAQQAVVAAGVAAPLMHLTGNFGAMVNMAGQSGVAKSTTAYLLASHWARPEYYVQNGTSAGATPKARIAHIENLGNLPAVVDEVTHMETHQAQNLTMTVTQPGRTVRLDRNGKVRQLSNNLVSSLLITTSNGSMHQLLASGNIAGDAGSYRLTEIGMVGLGIHTKAEADAMIRKMQQNNGHTGPAVIDYMLMHPEAVRDLVQRTKDSLEARGKMTPQERFWSSTFTLMVVGAILLRGLGVDYDPDEIARWCIEDLLPDMRGQVSETYLTPAENLQAMINSLQGDFLTVEPWKQGWGLVDKRLQPRNVKGRLEVPANKLWIAIGAIREWCEEHKIPMDAQLRSLVAKGIIRRDKIDLARHIHSYASVKTHVIEVDLAHPEMAGTSTEILHVPPATNVVPLRRGSV